MYRFRTVLEAVSEGDFSARIRLRRHDYLSDEATTINTMLESLRVRVEEIRAHQARLAELAEEMPEAPDRPCPGDQPSQVAASSVGSLKTRA